MKHVKTLVFVLVASLIGTQPAIAALQSTPAPLHLTYAFATYPTVNTNKAVADFTGAGTGTMTVTILGRNADGGLNVQAQDWWWGTVRPMQSVQCVVYSDGSISCDQDTVLEDPQLTLLPLLAQPFDPGTIRTAHSSVATSLPNSTNSIQNGNPSISDNGYTGYSVCLVDSTIVYTTPRTSDTMLTVDADGTYLVPCRPRRTLHSQTTIVYDSVRRIPTLIHSVRTTTSQSVFASTSVDVKLMP